MSATSIVPPPLADQWRSHATYCAATGAPLYATLMRGLADDLEAGGPVARLVVGRDGARVPDVLQLRILGGLHRLVLDGDAPELAEWYRTAGGDRDPEIAWPAARDAIEEHLDRLRVGLDHVPQTNEAGRSAALAAGLTAAAVRSGLGRIRLLELGSSAGLNLRVDRFRITGAGWSWGPEDSPVQLIDAVREGSSPHQALPGAGDVPGASGLAGLTGLAGAPIPQIVERRGCDLSPLDATDVQAQLRLLSYVWPDHVERFHRLRAALSVAARWPVVIDRAPLGAWIDRQLAAPAPEGVLTVVWHSIVMQYVSAAEKAQVAHAVAAAADRMPVVHLALEAPIAPYTTTPELRLDGTLLATVAAHGVPVAWRSEPA